MSVVVSVLVIVGLYMACIYILMISQTQTLHGVTKPKNNTHTHVHTHTLSHIHCHTYTHTHIHTHA
jgi:hypothetical protein